MKIIKPYHEILTPIDGVQMLKHIESCGRICYKSAAGYHIWERSCKNAETAYFDLLDFGCSPQEARAVLPNSLKTEIVMTADLREWRHFLKLRTSQAAHPQIREVAIPLLNELKSLIPVIFDDIEV